MLYSRPWSKTLAWPTAGRIKAFTPPSGNIAVPDNHVQTSYQADRTIHGLPSFSVRKRCYFELAYSTWIMMNYYSQMLQGVIRSLPRARVSLRRAAPESPVRPPFQEPSDFARIQ
ncbi:hypothetical protein CO700_08415 [Citrobacter koseri]|nr:hypothetical protein CO700_08415 [Citrobacter koseri]